MGAGAHGNQSGTVTVTYTDGTSSSGLVSLTDWWAVAPAVGDELVATATSGDGHPVGIYFASVALTAGRAPAVVELPPNANLHVFAIGIG